MLNKAILMGRLTKDPEIRYTTNENIPVCSFTLAIDRKYAKQGEEKQTDFIPIVTWRSLAEFCSKYFKKGMQVAVVGKIQTRNWDDAEGKKHYVTEIIADEAHFADTKKGSEGAPQDKFGTPPSSQGTDGFFPTVTEDDLPF